MQICVNIDDVGVSFDDDTIGWEAVETVLRMCGDAVIRLAEHQVAARIAYERSETEG